MARFARFDRPLLPLAPLSLPALPPITARVLPRSATVWAIWPVVGSMLMPTTLALAQAAGEAPDMGPAFSDRATGSDGLALRATTARSAVWQAVEDVRHSRAGGSLMPRRLSEEQRRALREQLRQAASPGLAVSPALPQPRAGTRRP